MFQAIDNTHPDPKGQVEMVLGKVLQGRLEEVRFLVVVFTRYDAVFLFYIIHQLFSTYACSF